MFECHDHYDPCFTLTHCTFHAVVVCVNATTTMIHVSHCTFDMVVSWLNAIDQWVFQCSTGFVDGGEFYYCSPLCFNTFVLFKVLVD